jgi:hypothetical protein
LLLRELIDARFLDEQEEQHTGLYVALADPADSGFTTGAVLSDLSNAATPSDAMPPLKHFPADHFNTPSSSSSPDLSNAATPNNATPPPKHWAGFDRSDHVPESAPGFGKMGVPVGRR